MTHRKGAVPVIATLLLLTIVAASVIVLYAYVSGANVLPDTNEQTGRMLEKLKTVEVKGNQIGQFNVSIMNVGGVDSVLDVFYVQDFSGGTLLAIPVSTTIPVGETRSFFFDSFWLGSGPWSWYEIIGVTDRGNKVRTNLFAFYSGAYELGERPGENEYDYAYGPYNVTIDNIPTSPTNLPNLTAIDGTYFGFPATQWNYSVVSFPTSVFEFDITDGIYHSKGDTSYLSSLSGEPYVLLYNTKLNDTTSFTSGNFSGNTGNYKYPKIVLTFIFYIQPARLSELSGTVQFFDWGSNKYVVSGNGYFTFNGTLPDAVPPAQAGFKNFTVEVDKGALVDADGNWNVVINMTTTNPTTVKLDYFAVTEKVEFIHGFETIFWYLASDVVDENNVTQILFATTGIFPPRDQNYWFQAFNYDLGRWIDLGTFEGSTNLQTIIYDINWPCSGFIDNSTKIIKTRIMPVGDLPDQEMLYIDQTRIIIRQTES